jgi:RimJ/RimL family protein N-acetyltransferase
MLHTSRTILRPLSIEHAEGFYNLNLDSDVLKYTGDFHFANLAVTQEFLSVYNQFEKYGVGRFAVIEKISNEFIGWCGLKYSVDLNEYDLGFRFFKKYWNKGFATETSKAFLDYGFNDLNISTIVGRAMKDNIASIKVLEKLGFSYSKSFNFDGNVGVIYSISSDEFNESIESSKLS